MRAGLGLEDCSRCFSWWCLRGDGVQSISSPALTGGASLSGCRQQTLVEALGFGVMDQRALTALRDLDLPGLHQGIEAAMGNPTWDAEFLDGMEDDSRHAANSDAFHVVSET